jgi:hypothetical protein
MTDFDGKAREKEFSNFEGLDIPQPTDIIWIAENVSIHCRAGYINKVQRLFLRFLTGWRYEKILKTKGE